MQTQAKYLISGISSIYEYCFACNPSPLLFPPTDTIPLSCSPPTNIPIDDTTTDHHRQSLIALDVGKTAIHYQWHTTAHPSLASKIAKISTPKLLFRPHYLCLRFYHDHHHSHIPIILILILQDQPH